MRDQSLFQVSADFDLETKPAWLEDFRAEYDLPYDYHVTLKTMTNFQIDDIDDLKADLKAIVGRYRPFTLVFDDLIKAPASSGWCVMIRARHNQELIDLQAEISKKLSKYGKHASGEREKHEKNFKPHITIARHLTPERLAKAEADLGRDVYCEAVIGGVTLGVAGEDVFEQWSDPANRFVMKFADAALDKTTDFR